MRWRQASLRGVAANPALLPHPAWFSMQAAPLVVFSTELSQTTQRCSRKPRSMQPLTTQEGVRWATSSSSPAGPAAICRPRMRLSAQCFCRMQNGRSGEQKLWSGGVAVSEAGGAGGAAEVQEARLPAVNAAPCKGRYGPSLPAHRQPALAERANPTAVKSFSRLPGCR